MRLSVLALALVTWACRSAGAPRPYTTPDRVLFDGLSLAHWEPVTFGGEGGLELGPEGLEMDFGSPLTGIVWAGEALPTEDYELELVARRTGGQDFFAGLTFPVGPGHASVILGGWGGALNGLSCVDGEDASQNATKTFRGWETGRDYRLVVRVGKDSVGAWVDGEPLFEQPRGDHVFDVRIELEPCLPLGLANYNSRSLIRGLRLRLAPGTSPVGASAP